MTDIKNIAVKKSATYDHLCELKFFAMGIKTDKFYTHKQAIGQGWRTTDPRVTS